MVLEIRTHPDKGRGGGWFENQRFWRTSFVDGPLWFRSLLACKIGRFGNPCMYVCIYLYMYVCMYVYTVAYIKLCIYRGGKRVTGNARYLI